MKKILFSYILLLVAIYAFAGNNIRLNYYYDVSKYVKDYARVTYNLSEDRMSFQVRDDGGVFFFPLTGKERADFVYMFHEGETTEKERITFLNRFIDRMMNYPPEYSTYHPFDGEAYSFNGINTSTETNEEEEVIDPLTNPVISFERASKDPDIVEYGQWNIWHDYTPNYDFLMFKPQGNMVDFKASIQGGTIEFAIKQQLSERFLNTVESIESPEQRVKYVDNFVSEVVTKIGSHDIPITFIPEHDVKNRMDLREYLSQQQRAIEEPSTPVSPNQNGAYGAYDAPTEQSQPQTDNGSSNNGSGSSGGGILGILIIIGLYYMFKGSKKSSISSDSKRAEEELRKKEREEERRQKEKHERQRRDQERRERERRDHENRLYDEYLRQQQNQRWD